MYFFLLGDLFPKQNMLLIIVIIIIIINQLLVINFQLTLRFCFQWVEDLGSEAETLTELLKVGII